MGKYDTVDPDALSTEAFLGMIDYTLLKPERSLADYVEFIREADKWGFRTVFLPPYYVPMAAGILSASDTIVGTPISFPYGYTTPETKASEALSALEDGARELDMVMNVSAALSSEWDLVEEDLREVAETVRAWEKATMSGPILLKVILETPYLNEQQIVEACRRAEKAGLDYVKTATGTGPGGATPEVIALMRKTVGDEMGVKAAGGVRTWEQAHEMIKAGANRIGTSTGPDIAGEFIASKVK